MLIIRLKPLGRKHRKHYRIVVSQKQRSVSKQSVEDIGWYNPLTKVLSVKKDRFDYYNNLNIEISATTRSLLLKNKIIT